MHDNATAHNENNFMYALQEVFGEQVLSQGFWNLKSPTLNAYDFYTQGMLREEV
jgi:hypothetical protein